ncbi:MAG: zinc ribbon domain-containing protein [Bacteroidaceae bacterium]|nr:zinc ribbon domain-containing protein [Bacteroidaceae bacterium]
MKYCSNCGTQLPDDAKFCFSCGTAASIPTPPTQESAAPSYHTPANAVPPTPPSAQTQTPPPPPSGSAAPLAATITGEKRQRRTYDEEVLQQGVTLCDDGKYRWIYALNMWKNPTILLLVVKIFFWIFVGIWALMILFHICEYKWDWDTIWGMTWPFLILMGVFAVITLLAYAIIAGMYGGKYIVRFTMDEQGILHEQIPSQAKKAQKLGAVTAVAGALTGKPAMVGLGVSSAARTSMSSDFASVRSVKAYKRTNVIKIREILSNNQVYVRDEDFDFVYNYIKSHCPRVK